MNVCPDCGFSRDAAVADLIARGWSYRRIAARLGCAVGTVHYSIQRTARSKNEHPQLNNTHEKTRRTP